jgi:hypothetical protein
MSYLSIKQSNLPVLLIPVEMYLDDKITLMPEHIPTFPTKFKKGDLVNYRDSRYKIIAFDNNSNGWQYILKASNSVIQVKISDGDKYFRKA